MRTCASLSFSQKSLSPYCSLPITIARGPRRSVFVCSSFAAGVVGVMPTYAILKDLSLDDQLVEQVGAGFSKQLLTDQLRTKHGFKGIVVSDWAITNDCPETCRDGFPKGQKPSFAGFSTAWGVEHLAKVDRYAKGVNAGLDQFGGVEDTAELVAAVKGGKIPQARIDDAARRILANPSNVARTDGVAAAASFSTRSSAASANVC